MESPLPLFQNYSLYLPEDQLVWKTLYERQMKRLSETACKEYLDAQQFIHFDPLHIPVVEKINQLLMDTTGWNLTVVPNIQPNEIFFPALSDKKFTATTWLRKYSQLDYISEPDMFHDVFGHVPLLSHPVFADFFNNFGKLGVRFMHNPKAIEMLGRIYWFTVEFGLIHQNDRTCIFGAGLISSYGESAHCMSDDVVIKPFDIHSIMAQSFNNSVMQDLYFVLPSFETLLNSLDEIEYVLQTEIGKG